MAPAPKGPRGSPSSATRRAYASLESLADLPSLHHSNGHLDEQHPQDRSGQPVASLVMDINRARGLEVAHLH